MKSSSNPSKQFHFTRYSMPAAIVFMLIAASQGHAQIFQHLTFKSITVPGATETEVTGTALRGNSGKQGDIVGFYVDLRGVNHGFFQDTTGKITTVNIPGSTGTWIYGIELSGLYIAGAYTGSNLIPHGFVRQMLPGAKFQTLDVPGATWTRAYTVDINGTVYGAYADNAGVIHGFSFNYPGSEGAFETIDFAGATRTEIHGSSNYGHGISGIFVDSSGAEHGAFGANGKFIGAIDFPGAGLTSVNGLDTGTGSFLVGYYGESATGPFHGFVTNDGNGRYQTIDFPGATDTRCDGMDDGYRITGRYTDTSGIVHGFTALAEF